jgi:hypothetical protein
VGDVSYSAGIDAAAVADDGGLVADGHDLIEAMGDIEDRGALEAQFAQDREEAFGFLGGESGGGLVQHIEAGGGAGFADKGAGNADQHLIAKGQRAQLLTGIDMGDAEFEQGLPGGGVELFPIDEGAGATRIGAAHEDVFGHGKGRDDVEFLVDEAQAEAMGLIGAVDMDRIAIEADIGAVGGGDAGQDFDEGGFAGAVFAHQSVNFTRRDVEVHTPKGRDAAIGLGHVFEGEEGHMGVLAGLGAVRQAESLLHQPEPPPPRLPRA